MKKQNLLFIPFILGLGIGLLSCNFNNNDSGNYQIFPTSPAVVDFRTDRDGLTICTPWGYIAAPSLALAGISEGDCIITKFIIDYDDQPSDKYYTATAIEQERVDQSYPTISNTIELEEYTLPLSVVNAEINDFFLGRFFIKATCKDKNPSFRLMFNPAEEETNGVKNFYLQTKPSSSTVSATDVSTFHAFDLSHIIQQYGRDTTKILNNFSDKCDFKYIKANLKYVSKITDNGPEYKWIGSAPIDFCIFKDQ